MSKSKGNVLDPHALVRLVGVDVLRYFLLKEGRLHDDAGQLREAFTIYRPK